MIDWCDFWCELSKWQTALAGLAALVGAYFTIRTMRHQIRQSDRHAEDVRKRKSRAARAAMPAALSSLIEYAGQCGILAAQIMQSVERNEVGRHANNSIQAAAVPPIPKEALATLKECIEYSEDEPAKRISLIFKSLQVQYSRLVGLVSDCQGQRRDSMRLGSIRVITTSNADSAIYDATRLYADVEKLFEYAREETESVTEEVERADVERVLFHLGIDEQAFPTVYQFVARRFPNSE